MQMYLSPIILVAYFIFLAAGIFQTLSITYSSTWAVQDGPPETTSDSLSALAE